MSYFMLSFVLHKSPVTRAGKTFHPHFRDGKTITHCFSPAGYSHFLPTLVLRELVLSHGFWIVAIHYQWLSTPPWLRSPLLSLELFSVTLPGETVKFGDETDWLQTSLVTAMIHAWTTQQLCTFAELWMYDDFLAELSAWKWLQPRSSPSCPAVLILLVPTNWVTLAFSFLYYIQLHCYSTLHVMPQPKNRPWNE